MSDRGMREQLAYIVASVNRQLEEELQERLRPAGLPLEQFRVLEALDRFGACPMGELATRALVEPPTLTKIIDRMVSDALVMRAPDPKDRRKVLVVMAPAGKVLHQRIAEIGSAQEERLTRQLPQDKLDELRSLLQALIKS